MVNAKIGNLKDFADAVNFLTERGIATLEDLEAHIAAQGERAEAINTSMKAKHERLNELKELLRLVDLYRDTKGAALKISRLPPDQQEEAAAVLTVSPPTPKQQGMKDSEAALSEFKALCARYVSGIESLHHRAEIFAGMTISQFDALGDSAYSVTTAIKGFFEKVHEIRHEMEKDHEN